MTGFTANLQLSKSMVRVATQGLLLCACAPGVVGVSLFHQFQVTSKSTGADYITLSLDNNINKALYEMYDNNKSAACASKIECRTTTNSPGSTCQYYKQGQPITQVWCGCNQAEGGQIELLGGGSMIYAPQDGYVSQIGDPTIWSNAKWNGSKYNQTPADTNPNVAVLLYVGSTDAYKQKEPKVAWQCAKCNSPDSSRGEWTCCSTLYGNFDPKKC